jgi:transposase
MAFGGDKCPPDHVVRTFRTKVTAGKGKTKRAFALLESAGDAWAWVIDRFYDRQRAGLPNANSLVELWPEQKAHGPFGDLTAHCAQDVTKAWSTAFFEVLKRTRSGEKASLPLKKRRLVPVRWRKGEFTLTPACGRRRARVELCARRGVKNLVLPLSQDHPYAPDTVREVKLVPEAGELFLDVTAYVPVERCATTRGVVSGVDPGVIHALTTTVGNDALVVSARALRAEEFLHLEDTKSRQLKQSTKKRPVRARAARPRAEGSRRWRKLQASQKKREAKNRRRVRQGVQRAANLAVAHIAAHGAHTVAIGDPRSVTDHDAGPVHNRRTHRWPVGFSLKVLGWRLEERGYSLSRSAQPTEHATYQFVDERGTSSHCPDCGSPARKSGRLLTCTNPQCRRRHHRDVAGSQNIARKLGAAPRQIAHIEHRRVGSPSRRDRRRHLYDNRVKETVPEALPVPGPPAPQWEESSVPGSPVA